MKTRISIAFIIVAAIFLGGCAAPQKGVVIQKPIKDDLDLKLTDLTKQIINSLTETRKSRIAIIEFSDLEGNITQFGKYLSEELITRLFRTGRFKVVERQFLNKIIEEHKLSYTHFFDEESVKEIGKLLGVDAIASGSVIDLGDSVKVNARLIATQTGSIFAVASVEIVKDKRVADMIARKAKSPYQKKKIVTKAPESPSPKPEEPKEEPKVAIKRVESNNFTFELNKVTKSDSGVICDLLITNNGEDRNLRLCGKYYSKHSRIFDKSGNAYNGDRAELGTARGRSAMYLLPSGIPIKGRVYFEKRSSQADEIVLMELFVVHGNRSIRVKFRDMLLSK